jgi:hypothetical protein
MLRRIEIKKKRAEEAEQAELEEKNRREQERIQEYEEREKQAFEALFSSQDYQNLLTFAQSEEIRKMLMEIYDYLTDSSKPIKAWSKSKKLPQIPFKPFFESDIDYQSWRNKFIVDIKIGFEYLTELSEEEHKNSENKDLINRKRFFIRVARENNKNFIYSSYINHVVDPWGPGYNETIWNKFSLPSEYLDSNEKLIAHENEQKTRLLPLEGGPQFRDKERTDWEISSLSESNQ